MRWSKKKVVLLAIAGLSLILLVFAGIHRNSEIVKEEEYQRDHRFFWQHYYALEGYFRGVQTLVPSAEYKPENGYNQSKPLSSVPNATLVTQPPLVPVVFDPYPEYNLPKYLQDNHPVEHCFLDVEDTIPAPEVYAYPGLTQHFPQPFYGSHTELGITNDMCFDRFGRLAAYGYGINETIYGDRSELYAQNPGADAILDRISPVNYSNVDWGAAQARCMQKNGVRFAASPGKKTLPRHAYVLRTWTGYEWDDLQIYSVRAMINELALKSGGEYDVHILLHVKNTSNPIWADKQSYNETLQTNVPKEFWNITTLWSVQQMMMYYPASFKENFANMVGSTAHGVYRSPHFALQWFSQQHPEYDFYWNWEMDIRYSGHYYELNSKIGEWAKKQPRRGLWERNSRFWLPEHHGTFENFSQFVEEETFATDISKNNLESSGPLPVWGPVQNFNNSGILPAPIDTTPPTTYEKDQHQWGVGEEADLIVFNPIFDPSRTNWVFRRDVTGYDTSLPLPPRRAAIITAARFSKRLINIMHEEVWRMGHTMFPEMFPQTTCLHHGLKAVYVPHPIYFDHDWDLAHMNQVLNYPRTPIDSPFGWGEHNLLGSTFYYNSGFAGKLWRRWLGQWGDKKEQEKLEGQTGRMCLPGMLFHPVKHEAERR